MQEAETQGVTSLAYSHFSKIIDKEIIPQKYFNTFRQRYIGTIGRNMLIFNELDKLLPLLGENGIEPIVLKGPALIATVFNDWGKRGMCDLDLLFKTDELQKVANILFENGYQIHSSNGALYDVDFGESHHLGGLVNPKTGVHLELHWTIQGNGRVFNINIDEMRQRTIDAQFREYRFKIFSPEDQLLHLFVHHCYHHFRQLNYRLLLDIYATLKQFENQLNWDEFLERCNRFKLLHPVYVGINEIRRLWNLPIPVEISNKIQVSVNQSQIAWYQLDSETAKSIIGKLVLIEGLSGKIQYIFRRIFPSRANIIRRYALVESSKIWWGYYFLRPFLLVKDHSLNYLKLIFNTFRSRFS